VLALAASTSSRRALQQIRPWASSISTLPAMSPRGSRGGRRDAGARGAETSFGSDHRCNAALETRVLALEVTNEGPMRSTASSLPNCARRLHSRARAAFRG
jgi:hypothetical protein